MASKPRGLANRIILLFVLAIFVAVGMLGWNWLNGLVLRTVHVTGNLEAHAGEVIAAARMDTGSALFGIDTALIADRVQRIPWVKQARVTRLPPSTLSIRIEERVPVVLVIDRHGDPSAYLDADGYVMPITELSTFDLPLLTGVALPTSPNSPVESRAVRELVQTVSALPPETDVLISSFIVEEDGQIALRSVPVNGQGSLFIRLGRRDFAEKMVRLRAFWHQAVVTRPDHTYHVIDLRFDSQIVTRETTDNSKRSAGLAARRY